MPLGKIFFNRADRDTRRNLLCFKVTDDSIFLRFQEADHMLICASPPSVFRRSVMSSGFSRDPTCSAIAASRSATILPKDVVFEASATGSWRWMFVCMEAPCSARLLLPFPSDG